MLENLAAILIALFLLGCGIPFLCLLVATINDLLNEPRPMETVPGDGSDVMEMMELYPRRSDPAVAERLRVLRENRLRIERERLQRLKA